jgi:hypothetical protein
MVLLLIVAGLDIFSWYVYTRRWSLLYWHSIYDSFVEEQAYIGAYHLHGHPLVIKDRAGENSRHLEHIAQHYSWSKIYSPQALNPQSLYYRPTLPATHHEDDLPNQS